MNVAPFAWFIAGTGAYLMVSGFQNISPKKRLLAVLKGEPDPKEPWFALPDLKRLAKTTDEYADQQGKQSGSGAGSAGGGSSSGGVSSKRQSVIDFGRAQLGERYVFGSAGPDTWDCSGLTKKAYATVGVNLPHYAAAQQTMGSRVTMANAQPGDLVFWGPVSGHVGIWLGNQQVLHAPKTGDVVKISSLWNQSQANFRSYL